MSTDPQIILRSLTALACLFLCIALPVPVGAQTSDGEEPPANLAEALSDGKASVFLRYRYETVDQDGITEEAQASTLRSTVSYGSAPYKGFRLFLEAENVTAVFDDDEYNNAGAGSLNNGVRDRPVVADPSLTEINQAYLEFAADKATLRLGRQEVNLGNQRFVGAVGWRQHHQSFTALSLVGKPSDKVSLSYQYLTKAHRIFGDSQDMGSHLANIDFKPGARDQIGVYGYVLDYDDVATSGLSTATYGVRWSGHRMAGNTRISYTLEAAQQEDAGDNPRAIDADYALAELAAGSKAFTITLGYEVLSGSPEDGAFTTPLATLHKFNGWADKFLRTPTNGLEDLYLGLSGGSKKFRWKVFYHDFQPENGGADYGTELDLEATFKTARGITFGLKGAFYDADSFATDTEKIWFWTAFRFGN